ncbi:MAG: OsmC family protein [Mariniblastus sp.]|nr:OsmC family protein [Mariniblastus sp.]
MAHQYVASAAVNPESLVSLEVEGLPKIESGPPKEFGGSGEQWSPEDLLVGAVADCFVLSFKAIAAASKYTWSDLSCSVTGTLDRIERATQFTELKIKANLTVPADADVDRAKRLLEKAEQTCFITNSLKAEPTLEVEIQIG